MESDDEETTINLNQGFRCINKAIELDNTNPAYWYYLSKCYFNGLGTLFENEKAIDCIKKAKEMGGNLLVYENEIDYDNLKREINSLKWGVSVNIKEITIIMTNQIDESTIFLRQN